MSKHLITLFVCWLCICSFKVGGQQHEETMLTASQIKQDFQQLYSELQLAHYDTFFNLPKKQYDKKFEQFLLSITSPMSKLEVQVLFQQFMALGRIAHSKVDWPIAAYQAYRADGGKSLPLYVSVSKRQMWVSDYYGEEAGVERFDEVLAIDGLSSAQWLDRFASHISADNQRLSNTLIQNIFPLVLWLELGEKDAYEITLKSPSGGIKTVLVSALTQQQVSQKVSALTDSPEEDLTVQTARMLDNDIAYLRPGPFYNTQSENVWDNTDFVNFIDSAFTSFNEQKAKALLIDLRSNPGGTNSFSDPMIAWFADKPFRFASEFIVKVSPQSQAANDERLKTSTDSSDISHKLAEFYNTHKHGETFTFSLPDALPNKNKRFNGDVYVLVNRNSYSNAVSVAAIVQDYGFGQVIGEETADLATTLGAMESFTLRHTGIKVGYPKALIIRPNGSRVPEGVTPDYLIDIDMTQDQQRFMFEKAVAKIKIDLASGKKTPN